MNKEKWIKTIAAVAPAIATALGGPMAGVAVGMATKALGIENGDEDALGAAVASGDPDVLVKLKEVEYNFKLELKRMGVKLEELNVADRKSARELAAARGMRPQVILGTVYTAGFVWLLFALFTGEVDIEQDHQGIASILLGMLGAGQAQVLNFFFGSSSGSKEKTQQLERIQ